MTHKTYQPDERVGVWIDHKVAYFIKVSGDHSPTIEELGSGIQSRKDSGIDAKTSIHMAHSVLNGHDKMHQHQLHELHTFYVAIVHKLRSVDYVYLFGPGEAKHGLNRAIAREGT